MYCRNCGAILNENDEKCEKCSFVRGYGKRYCSVCGNALSEEQKICPNCGNEVKSAPKSEVEARKRGQDIVEKYGKTVNKLNLLRLILSACALMLIVTLIFVPIYKCNYVPISEDVSNINDIKDVIEDGRVEKNFSLYEDFSQMLDLLFDKTDKAGTEKLLVLEFGVFAIFEVIFAALLAVLTSKQLIESIIKLRKNEETTVIVYDGIRKYGDEYTRTGLFRRNAVIGLVIYASFDVIFTQIFSLYTGIGEMTFFYRYMLDVSGLSGFFFIALALTVAVAALKVIVKREERKLSFNIIKENI